MKRGLIDRFGANKYFVMKRPQWLSFVLHTNTSAVENILKKELYCATIYSKTKANLMRWEMFKKNSWPEDSDTKNFMPVV